MGVYSPHKRVTFRQACVKDIGTSECLGRVTDHVCENPEFAERQGQGDTLPAPVDEDRVAAEIYLYRTETANGVLPLSQNSPQNSLDPRNDFLRVERFHNVIVGTQM